MPVVKNLMVRAGADFSPITTQARRAQRGMQDMSRSVKASCGAMSSAVSGLKSAFGALGITLGAAALVSFGKNAKTAYDEASEAQAKLAAVMRRTMGAANEEIQAVNELADAQQALGVIDADVTREGAQELATYLELSSSLQTLVPVMNDMLAQQYGLNATSESAASIATMLGKVMNGQVSALSRYGYSFTEAQAQILKFGTEEQRAAVLAEVVEESVGGMNRALAMTPSGRLKQVSFALGDVQEQFGKAVTQILTVFLPVINRVTAALAVVAEFANRVAQSIANVFGSKTTVMANAFTGVSAGAAGAAEGIDAVADATEAAGKAAKGLSTAGFDTLQKLSGASSGSAASTEADGSTAGSGAILTGAELGGPAEGYSALEGALTRVKGIFEEIEPVIGRVRESIERVSGLLSGEISIADYFGDLTPVETVLWSIAGALGAMAVIKTIGALAQLAGIVAGLPIWLQISSVFKLCAIEGWKLSSAIGAVFGSSTALFGGIAALIGGAVLAVTNFLGMWREGFSWLRETLMLLGIALGAVGAIVLGAPALVAGVVAGIVATVATAAVLIHDNWEAVKTHLLGVWDSIKQGVTVRLDNLKLYFSSWWKVISGLATGNFRKLGEGVKGIAKSMVNFVIDALNTLIAGVNAVAAPLRLLIVGIGKATGKGLTMESVRIPSIPRLATGAVLEANRPFAAVLGDQKSGRNIETPERLLRQIYREENRGVNDEVVELLGELLGAVRAGKVLTVDRKVLAHVTGRAMSDRARGSGADAVPLR